MASLKPVQNVKTGLSLNEIPFRKFCKLLKQKKHIQNTPEFNTKLNPYLISKDSQSYHYLSVKMIYILWEQQCREITIFSSDQDQVNNY